MNGVLCRTMAEVQEFLDASVFSWEGRPILWSSEIDGEDRVHSFRMGRYDEDIRYKDRKWFLTSDQKPDLILRRKKDKPFDVDHIYGILSLTGNRYTGHPLHDQRDVPF